MDNFNPWILSSKFLPIMDFIGIKKIILYSDDLFYSRAVFFILRLPENQDLPTWAVCSLIRHLSDPMPVEP